ncbi:hypothetical protein UO65_0028 [Actinokineospora spheciospongiae]|uniref:Uncharacterized protein n=1 Tax=Actinokineospora spheciospongiae TaxID=909613 RepID=W7J6N6_9PSEU|nr:hypothetical protein UO65_0028 [Actinokineospora spheciospongiae]
MEQGRRGIHDRHRFVRISHLFGPGLAVRCPMHVTPGHRRPAAPVGVFVSCFTRVSYV